MTAALIIAAVGLMSWPRAIVDADRIGRLRADRRLMPAPAPTGLFSGGLFAGGQLSRAPTDALLAAPVAAAVSLVAALLLVVLLAPSQGASAAVEFGFCAAVVLLAGFGVARRTLDGRREAVRAALIASAVAVLLAEVDAGASPDEALRAVPDAISRRLRADPAELPGRAGVDDPLARVAFAWQLSAATGIPLVDSLARVRTDLADRASTRREVATLVAGPQASATILALLPVLGMALGSAIGADPGGVLFGTPAGRLLLCLGVLLDAAGLWWTLRLIDGAIR